MRKDKERVSWFMITIEFTKVNGRMILNMGRDFKNSPINVYTRVSMWMVNLKELVNIHGRMVNFMKDNGTMEWKMVQECGEVQREIHT